MQLAPSAHPAPSLQTLLRWYAEMGVDIAIAATPQDRFAQSAAVARLSNARVDTPPQSVMIDAVPQRPQSVTGVPELGRSATGALDASALAAAAMTLAQLRRALENFEGCALRATATQLVFADGNPQARIMLVGDVPGADEDRLGHPFAGRTGQLLDKMLATIGLDRTSVYLANVVPWRPPGNRAASAQEIAAVLPFIMRHIQLAQPRLLICLGGTAAQILLKTSDGIARIRGRWFDAVVNEQPVRALAMLHPLFLLRQPSLKRQAWADLQDLRRAMDALQ